LSRKTIFEWNGNYRVPIQFQSNFLFKVTIGERLGRSIMQILFRSKWKLLANKNLTYLFNLIQMKPIIINLVYKYRSTGSNLTKTDKISNLIRILFNLHTFLSISRSFEVEHLRNVDFYLKLNKNIFFSHFKWWNFFFKMKTACQMGIQDWHFCTTRLFIFEAAKSLTFPLFIQLLI